MNSYSMFAAALLCGSLVLSQAAYGQIPARRYAGPPEFGFRAGKLVTGIPYSADVGNSSVKTLADGNTIQRSMTGHVARDTAGRTFASETITGLFGQSGSKTITFISDPVAGYSYTLNADTKIATRRPFHARAGEYEPRLAKKNPDVDSVDLGTQAINGFAVNGKKVTHTIPAGEMGNAQPIISTSETWFSPELKVMLSAQRTDPREGVSTYTLNNIQRAEPPSSLFEIPQDYTVKDAPSFKRPDTAQASPAPLR